MNIGFTGTRHGMTESQKNALDNFLRGLTHKLQASFHHGDCVGADADAHDIAENHCSPIVVHPPNRNSLRANCRFDEMRRPEPYLVRNRNIVDQTEILIACPAEMTEQQRGGTWSTVRYARSKGREICIILPDGSITRIGGKL